MSACYVPDTMLSKEDIKISNHCVQDATNSFLISCLLFFLTKRIPVLPKVAMCLTRSLLFLDFSVAKADHVIQFCPIRSRKKLAKEFWHLYCIYLNFI